MVIRRPMGVCAAITPYNFPLTLLGTKVAPALASGNTVVAKPASTTPLATLEVARLFAEAGVPDGVLNVVTGRGATIGDALVGHPDVRRIAFTGETATGGDIMSIAGPALKRVTLELGGSDPVIICADADVDAAVKAVIIGRYWNAGQACLGCKRVFVADAVYDDFASQLVDRSAATSPATGRSRPRSRACGWARSTPASARDELVAQLEDGVAKGGELLIGGGTGGHDKGWFLEPAVVAEPGADSRLVTEEVFGPVLPIFRFADLDEAIAARQRHALRAGLVDLDARRAQRPPRRAGDRRRDDVGQPDPLRLRRAALRRDQGLGLRQGARPGGARQLRRAQVGRRRRAGLMAVTYRPTGRSAPSPSTSRRRTPTTSRW